MKRFDIAWTAVVAAALAVATIVSGYIEYQMTLALGFAALVAAALSFRER
jgi:hypothetical protein